MDGFELIGLNEGKMILEETVKRFGTRPSFDREERENALDLIDDDFDDLDSDFYNLDARVNIIQLITDYIRNNRIAFYFEGYVEMPED